MMEFSKSKKYGFGVYWDHDDSFVGQVVANDNYEPYESDLFLSYVKPDSVIFDVGANIGYYALLAGLKVQSGKGAIIAFEPGNRNFELLEKNVAVNNSSVIQPKKMALAEEPGTKELYLSVTNKGDHQLYYSPDRISELVSTTSIDAFVVDSALQPTILKIDTQGYDYAVLRGAVNFINTVDNLVVFTEFWDYGNKLAHLSSAEYFHFLLTHFKEVRYIDEEKQATYPVDFQFMETVCSNHDNYGHGNLLCIK